MPGHDEARVKQRFGKLFGIDDPERLEHFFSGQDIILRRNLDRKVAGEYYSKMRKAGLESRLDKVETSWAVGSAATKEKHAERVQAADEAARALAEREQERRNKAEDAVRRKAEDAAQKRREAEQERARERTALIAARQQEEQRKAIENAALLEAQQEKQRKALEKAARLKAEKDAEEATRLKAAKEAAQLAAQRKAELERKAEEAARLKAQQEEEKRKAAAAAAKRKAELADKKRLQAEATARRREEEAARKKALREEAQRKAAEDAAKRKAELAEKKRIQAEVAAKRKAEQEEKRRLKAEEAARLKALKEEENRKAAAETARRKAEESARLKAQREEEKRKAAEQAARLKLEKEAQRKLKAEEAARLKVQREEDQRKAAEVAARTKAELEKKQQLKREADRKKAAQEAAKQHAVKQEQARIAAAKAAQRTAELEEKKRREAELAALQKARIEAEKQRIAEEAARLQAERLEMETQAIDRAAQKLAQGASLKSTKAGVRSKLDLPRRGATESSATPRRQQGAPNPYNLRPFRNTPEARERPQQAVQQQRKTLMIASLALAVLLILSGVYLSRPAAKLIQGVDAIAVNGLSQLLLLAGDEIYLHDRSGLGLLNFTPDALGLTAFRAPLTFSHDNMLLLQGTTGQDGHWQTMRCDLDTSACEALSGTDSSNTIALTAHTLTGELFLTNSGTGELIKQSPRGEQLAKATLELPEHPILRLNSGLLFMNSPHGPAISVFRYENQAFGKQLDEILLLPPTAMELEQAAVWDFVLSGGHWWVTLYNQETQSAGLYRFDSQWNFLDQVPLEPDSWPQHLANWSEKTLIGEARSLTLQRFNASGQAEVSLSPDTLAADATARKRNSWLRNTGWSLALALCLLLTLAMLGLSCLHHWRALVYRARPARGAVLLDELNSDTNWIDRVNTREKQLKHYGIAYAVFTLSVVLLMIGLTISPPLLVAIFVVLTGPLIALFLLRGAPDGHIGVVGEQLVLVDHNNMYHCAGGPRLYYRGPFLLIDDVVVFSGNALLAVFCPEQLLAQVQPLAQAGIRVDRKTVLIKLLQSRHPLIQGGISIAAALCLGLIIIALANLL